jgi:hypothetical protein
VEEDPGTSIQRIAAAEDISVPLVWRILCEQTLPTPHPATASLTPTDHYARVVFSQWLLTKCIVNTQLIVNIQFIDERFTRDGIVNFHNTHIGVDDNLHTTMASRHHINFLLTSEWAS